MIFGGLILDQCYSECARMEITQVLSWIVVGLLVIAYVAHRWKFRSLRTIPGTDPDYPLLGNIPLFLKGGSAYMKLFRNEHRMSKIWLGPVPLINAQHPELVLKVLNECLDKPFAYDFMELGPGLISERCECMKDL